MKPRRWLSMLLALVMVLSLIPASVFAADGEEAKGYQIVIGEQATEMIVLGDALVFDASNVEQFNY